MQIQNIQPQSFKALIKYDGPYSKKSVDKQAEKEINRIRTVQAKINDTIDILNSKEVQEKIKNLPKEDCISVSTINEDEQRRLETPYLVYSAYNPNSVKLEREAGILRCPYLSLYGKRNLSKHINKWLDDLNAFYGK